ncbi:MAG: helix-turn-helix domain-containing protein [Rhodoferax sp.]|nr:helix-turn-helix domain-containing protein [Rhodoferax sp.]MCF8211512.1 helix-turn-helix domain-containing protein [Rhodoferax sp.]
MLPGWHAQSGPHLEQIVDQARSALERLVQVHAAGGLVTGLFNAAALLGEAGLLQGRCAAVPWAFVRPVRRHSEGVTLLTDRPWTVDERIWTCDSPVLATEVILDMLRHTAVAELAKSAAHVYLHSEARQQVAVGIVQGDLPRGLPAGALERARRWLEDHMTEPYSLATIAQAAATSPRTLLRHFASTYSQSPLDYLHSLRVARARVLLETTYVGVEQVAQMCGYQDTGTFRCLFARQTGELPAAYRDRYILRTSRKRWVGAV